MLHQNGVAQVIADALQQREAQLLVRDLAATEPQRDLALVALFEEATDVAHLDVVVAIIGTGSELDFLDLDHLLLRLRLGGLLLLVVLELSVLDQSTDRRIGRRNNFNQIHVLLTRKTQGFGKTYHTQRLVLGPDQADFRGHDFPVKAVLALLAVAAVAECSSDGQFLRKTSHENVATAAALRTHKQPES
ncbi:conserved hypothetical protein [Burkholderiales bacterium 8X]|nr:conserved hypothetical protein [Burkholderiales bacterium 8X]